jgi:uncharacterized protein involved in response to NO
MWFYQAMARPAANNYETTTRHPVEPWRIFFPSALALAPLNVLLWLAARGALVSAPGIGSAVWHGREMLFGYSFAVIAGYLLEAMPLRILLALWLLWLAPRGLWMLPPGTLPVTTELALTALFPAALAVYGVRRFASIRRLQNVVFPVAMAALGVAGVVTYASQLGLLAWPGQGPAVLSAYVVSLLIVTMGGRLVPTATVGALRARGWIVRIPTRPLLEAACAVGVLLLIGAEAGGLPLAAGALALTVAGLLLARLAGWHWRHVGHDPEVWPLHLGFAWLATGFVLIGLERWSLLLLPDAGALHALAVGGIGTVTLLMMIRVSRYRTGRGGVPGTAINLMQMVLALAVIVRVAGGALWPAYRDAALWIAAVLWALAYASSAVILMPLALQSGRR